MKNRREFVLAESIEWETVADGVRRQVLAYGPDLMVVRVDFVKGAVGAAHQHPHRQVTYVAKGKFEATVGGRREVLAEGDTFFADGNVQHGVMALEDGTLVDSFTPAREEFIGSRG